MWIVLFLTGTLSQIAVSDDHSCGILVNGSLTCWGLNEHGQCNVPDIGMAWLKLPDVLHDEATCAIAIDGSLHCWGDGDESIWVTQLNMAAAEKEGGAPSWVDVSEGTRLNALCAVSQEGYGYCEPNSLSAAVEDWKWSRLVVMSSGVCGLSQYGKAFCWHRDQDFSEAVELKIPGHAVLDHLSAGGMEFVCVQAEARVRCWAWKFFSPLEIHDDDVALSYAWKSFSAPCGLTKEGMTLCFSRWEPPTPSTTTFHLSKWHAVAASWNRRCALSTEGEIFCWGEEPEKSVRVPADTTFVTLKGFRDRYGALSDTGKVHLWGDTIWSSLHAFLRRDITSKAISVGLDHVCVIDLADHVVCGGACFYGECDPPGGDSVTWISISAEAWSTCGVTSDHTLCCWGSGFPIELSCTVEAQNPRIEPLQWEWVASGGTGVSCAVAGNMLQCWEMHGLWEPFVSPSGWLHVSIAQSQLCAVKGSNELFCTFSSPLLDYDPTSPGNPGWKAVSLLSSSGECGLLTNGTAVCANWLQYQDPMVSPRRLDQYYVFMAHVQWREFVMGIHALCGITMDNDTVCWSPLRPLGPAEDPGGLDIRFAHVAGLRTSRREVCGYRYLDQQYMCVRWDASGVSLSANEVLFPLGDWRLKARPQGSYVTGANKPVELWPVAEPHQQPFDLVFPMAVRWALVHGDSATLIIAVNEYAAYIKSEIAMIRVTDFTDVTPIPVFTELIEAAASGTSVCVVSAALRVWCDGPASEGLGDIGKVSGLSVSDSHACGIKHDIKTVVCWGQHPPPPAPGPLETTTIRQVSTAANATCIVTMGYRIKCWGVQAVVEACDAALGGSGWMEVYTNSFLVCGSHINGRLRCLDIERAMYGQPSPSVTIPVVVSNPQTVIGFGHTSGDLCASSTSCIKEQSGNVPYHTAALLIGDVAFQQPYVSAANYFGIRTESMTNHPRHTIRCSPMSSACITFRASPQGVLVLGLTVIGTRGVPVLRVDYRPSFTVINTVWLLAPSNMHDQSSFTVSNVDTVALHTSVWQSQGNQSSVPENATPKDSGTSEGVVTIFEARLITVTNCSWRNLTRGDGAPLVLHQANVSLHELSIVNGLFLGNTGWGRSGGVFIQDAAHDAAARSRRHRIESSTFKGNGGNFAGAVAWWWTIDSKAGQDAACFACSSGNIPSLFVSDSMFTNNIATYFGGAITLDGVAVSLTAVEFYQNRAEMTGGAIYVVNGSLVSVDSTYDENKAMPMTNWHGKSRGGAMYVSQCNRAGLSVLRSTFTRNVADGDANTQGGALFAHGCQVSLSESFFGNNIAYGRGGAMYLDSAPRTSTIEHVTFENNEAFFSGGAATIITSAVAVTGIGCNNNSVTFSSALEGEITSPQEVEGIGGCLQLKEGASVDLRSSVVMHNDATQGGGIYGHCGSELSMLHLSFKENTSPVRGASLFFECASPWLDTDKLKEADVQLPFNATPKAVGSGPVAIQLLHKLPSILDRRIEFFRDTMVLALVDVHGNTVVEKVTPCHVSVTSATGYDFFTQLLTPSVYYAQEGILRISPFGVSTYESEVLATISCGIHLTASVVLPIARVVPSWKVPPPSSWVPSSILTTNYIEPAPVVGLSTEHGDDDALHEVIIECIVAADAVDDENGSLVGMARPARFANLDDSHKEIVLEFLAVAGPYLAEVVITVQCFRDHELLPPLEAFLTLEPPEALVWATPPPVIIPPGGTFSMAIAFIPETFPAMGTECRASLEDDVNMTAFLRNTDAYVRDDIPVWDFLEIYGGAPGSTHTLSITCETALQRMPLNLTATIAIEECPQGTEPYSDSMCRTCHTGTYSLGGLEPCRPCPAVGVRCSYGYLSLLDGYYPASSAYVHGWPSDAGDTPSSPAPFSDATVLYPCKPTHACVVAGHNASYTCNVGFEGPLCGACRAGFIRSGEDCVPCEFQWLSILVLAIAVVTGLGSVLYNVVCKSSRAHEDTPSKVQALLRILISYSQTLETISLFEASEGETTLSSAAVLRISECIWPLDYYSKLVFHITLPCLLWLTIVVIVVLAIVMRCYGTPTARTIPEAGDTADRPGRPLSLSLPTFVPRVPWRTYKGWGTWKQNLITYFKFKPFLGYMVVVYALFYNHILTGLTSVFGCRDEVVDGRQFLEATVHEECYTTTHITVMVVCGVLVLLLNVVVPMVFLIILHKNRNRLHIPKMRQRLGFLYAGYSEERGLYWWEVVVMLRKFLLVMVTVTISDPFYQAVAGIIETMAFYLVQVSYNPYEWRFLNRLEAMTMSCVGVTQLVSLTWLYRDAVSDGWEHGYTDLGVTMAVMILNVLCFAILYVALGCVCYRRCKVRKLKTRRSRKNRFAAAANIEPQDWHPSPLTASADTHPRGESGGQAHGPKAMVYSTPWLWGGKGPHPSTLLPALSLHRSRAPSPH